MAATQANVIPAVLLAFMALIFISEVNHNRSPISLGTSRSCRCRRTWGRQTRFWYHALSMLLLLLLPLELLLVLDLLQLQLQNLPFLLLQLLLLHLLLLLLPLLLQLSLLLPFLLQFSLLNLLLLLALLPVLTLLSVMSVMSVIVMVLLAHHQMGTRRQSILPMLRCHLLLLPLKKLPSQPRTHHVLSLCRQKTALLTALQPR